MADDMDHVPVKENSHFKETALDPAAQKAAQQRHLVARLSREDLEDRFFRISEENLALKKYARKQEEKIKRMATKLLRLVSDKKKAEQSHGVKKVRDIETEEMLEDLHGKIRDLEKQNHQLKEKLMVTKQQLQTQGKRNTPYPYIQSRIDTGIQKAPVDTRLQKSVRVTPAPPTTRGTSPMPRYGQSLLDDARTEIRHQEDVIGHLQEQINIYEQDIEMLKEQMRVREAEFEEDLLKIKQQMTQGQRSNIQENIDIIRLQREVKEKATKLAAVGAQYANLEQKMSQMKMSHDSVLAEMESLTQQLKAEQTKSLSLQNQLMSGTQSQHVQVELQERIRDLENEIEILKEANEKLVNSAFDMEREREWKKRENALKVQIAQLEATLRADVGEKGNILDKLTGEKDAHDALQEEHREIKIKFYQLKQEHDDLKEKMGFFTKESAVDFQEIEEALMIVKQKKMQGEQELEFLQKVDDEKNKDYEKLVRELQVEHADTINELEKMRNMLIVQHKINKDYQQEVEAVTRKMDQDRTEYEAKLEEYAQLLDIRAARIRKLEGQLKDVAYGTRQYRLQAEEDASEVDEIDETVHLERGQNLFEIHVKRVLLSPEGIKALGDDEPNLFCTWEFFEFEIQATPVVRGSKPEFEFTSQYVVKVDDFFLVYLQKDSTTLELHQSFGTDYRTVAACQLKMSELLDKSHGRLHSSSPLMGVSDSGVGLNYGTVEYWVRLRVPMDQALRLYKERTKAMGYIASNTQAADQALRALDDQAAQRPDDNINQLHIKVMKCGDIKARREGVQPHPYAVYKFFDFNDHDTTIIMGSNTPQFNDHKVFPVAMTADLDRYLKSQPLLVYVFDDADPDDAEYIGYASVPLISLAHDKAIKGIFELKTKQGAVNGHIEIHLHWDTTYIPPKASTKTPAQLLATTPEKPEGVALMPGEELTHAQKPLTRGLTAEGITPQKAVPGHMAVPVASSTPHPNARKGLLPPSGQQEGPLAMDLGDQLPAEAPVVTVTSPQPEDEGVTEVQVQHEQDLSAIQPVSTIETASRLVQSSTIQEETEPSESTPAPADIVNPKSTLESQLEVRREQTRKKLKEAASKSDMEGTLTHSIVAESVENQDLQATGEHPYSDTYFGDEEENEEATDPTARSERSDTDSDVVMSSPKSRPSSVLSAANSDIVTVTISQVTLDADNRVMDDPSIQMLFVEYRFLGIDLQELETPFSLPKPAPGHSIVFNFKKVFHVDFQNNYERRQYLASMLLPDDPEDGRIRFTLVSEPPEDNQDADCEDVGAAFVSVRDILNNKRDLVDQEVPIYDVLEETTVIGSLKVTVECLAALLTVQQEMQ